MSLSIAAVATAVLMALALGLQTLKNLREDQGRNALRLGHAMSGVLVQALRHDDVWLAYSLLRGPEHEAADTAWVLVDESDRVFASNQPARYRVGQPLAEALPWLSLPSQGQTAASGGSPRLIALASDPGGSADVGHDRPRRLLRLPLSSDGSVDATAVGELIAAAVGRALSEPLPRDPAWRPAGDHRRPPGLAFHWAGSGGDAWRRR